jgi:cold shock CspA family protein
MLLFNPHCLLPACKLIYFLKRWELEKFNKGRGPGSMPRGKVKWFSERIGAGFIRTEEGKDVFFNIKAVHDCDLQIMQRGQCVSFDILKNEDRIPLSAANVKTIESSACDLM